MNLAIGVKAKRMEQHIEALEQYNKKLKDRIKALETENKEYKADEDDRKRRLIESARHMAYSAPFAATKVYNDPWVKAARFAMDAKNAKDRIKFLEARAKELKRDYRNACAVGDSLKEQILKMTQQRENAELAAEALKAKLERKNEQIQRLTEANAGYNKGIRRLRKRIYDMERIAFIRKDGIKSMRQQVSDLMKQNNQLRDELAQKAAELEKTEGKV